MIKKKIIYAVMVLLLAGVALFFIIKWRVPQADQKITNFDQCVAAGNPILESYPEQCRTPDGRQFINERQSVSPEDTQTPGQKSTMSMSEAKIIAEASGCAAMGEVTEKAFYNENSRTWWLDMIMFPENEKQSCAPACVVSEQEKTAEINWRCTGLLPE